VRLAAAGLAVATGTLLALALATAVVSGQTRPPADRLETARAAVAATAAGPARKWAPEETRAAASALAAAETEYARQAARIWPRRNFEAAADLCWATESTAREAARLGEERRVAARARTRDAVGETRALLAEGERLGGATSLPTAERVHLARARVLVAEADALVAAEEYELAVARADAGSRELARALGPSLLRARRYTSEEQVATWKRWIEDTRAWSRASGRPAIVVVKERNELRLIERGRSVARFDADIGSNALGRKLHAGDQATPEGRYRVVAKKEGSHTRFHKALLLDYPNEADRRRIADARRAGVLPRGTQAGGLIEIHGEGGRGRNWTDGCVALSNADIDALFARVEVGSWVTIVGGDGGSGTFSDLVDRLDGGGRP
jgi:hypothetical protein